MARRRASKKEIAERMKLLEQGLKLCLNCETIKRVSEFAEDKRHYDGLQTYCRDCCNELRRTKYRENIKKTEQAWYQENRERLRVIKRKYMSRNRAYFDEKSREWIEANRERYLARKKRYHQANRERDNTQARKRMKQWIKDNPERFRENCRRREMRKKNAEGSHDLNQWETLLEMCGGVCLACGTTEDITHDHIKPLAWGGTDYIDNIQPLCKPCNCVKQDHYAADYRPRRCRRWAHRQVQNELVNS